MNDPFAKLGIPRRFDLDAADLHRRFIQASAATHPDRFTDPDEQADAADRAATLNDACRVLADPERRARALLTLLAGQAPSASDNALPPGFLAQVMELRERLDDALDSNDPAELAELRLLVAHERAARLERIASLFRQALAQPANAETLADIRLELNVLRYFERMAEQLPPA